MNKYWLVFLLSIITVKVTQAEIYKIIDADGNVTYTQKKPTNAENVKTIKTQKFVAPEPVEKKSDTPAEESQEANSDPNSEAVPSAEQQAENALIKQQNCENSKTQLTQLNNAGRIKFTGEDGNVKWASEEEVQARKDQLKNNIDKWCNES